VRGEWKREFTVALAEARSPRKRLVRARRRGRRRTVFRALATLALAWWTSVIGSHPGIEGSEIVVGSVTAVAGLRTVSAAARWAQLERMPLPLPAAGAPPELPPEGSAARVPMERLANRERALAELLALLGDAASDVAAEAGQAAVTLREYGARLRAVESARDGAEGEAAVGLDAAVATLRQRLEEGVSAYDRLVAVAAEAVSAGTAGSLDALAVRRLEDAADTLAGLARGLREVRASGEPTKLPPG
jgi:hypothetical protein